MPVGIAITPDGKTAYVANANSNTVTPIDTATNTAVTPIWPVTNPVGVAITPDGKTAYVTNSASNAVTPIATATNTAGTPIAVGSVPDCDRDHPGRQDRLRRKHRLRERHPDRHRHQHGGDADRGRHQPARVAITPDGTPAYVVNNGSNNVTLIATATNTAGTPSPPAPIRAGSRSRPTARRPTSPTGAPTMSP